jgi:hypothetical protein
MDLLLFELEHRYREYDHLVAATECIHRGASTRKQSAADIKRLRNVRSSLRDVLSASERTLDDLTHVRDEVITDGSVVAARLARDILDERSKRDNDGLDKLIRACGL